MEVPRSAYKPHDFHVWRIMSRDLLRQNVPWGKWFSVNNVLFACLCILFYIFHSFLYSKTYCICLKFSVDLVDKTCAIYWIRLNHCSVLMNIGTDRKFPLAEKDRDSRLLKTLVDPTISSRPNYSDFWDWSLTLKRNLSSRQDIVFLKKDLL